MTFQELFIWLAREHQLSQLIDAPGRSCWLLGALWAPMVALGGSWRKYMKTIILLSKTCTFHSPRLFWTSPKTYILDHSKCMKTIVLSTSGSKAKNHQIKSHGAGFDDLVRYYIRRTFYYRIIVHWVTCSWVPCLFTEPAGDPRKKCVYAKVFP